MFAAIIFIVLVLLSILLLIYLLANGIMAVLKKAGPKEPAQKRIGRIKKSGMMLAASLTAILLLVFYSQIYAQTPAIRDETGATPQNSIAVLEKVTLNGRSEWISIRGHDRDNPVILFLAGGPGGTQMAAVRKNLAALEKDYVVVNWDQPGSGKSYNALPVEQINADTYMADGIALTEHLRQRFGKEKIYLLGESWGSALGIFLAGQRPEYYAALIGTGQMVDFEATEIWDYHKALDIARAKNDTAKIARLEANGPPPYYGKDVTWKSAEYLNYLSSYMAANSEIHNAGFDTIGDIMSPEYGLVDKINFARGLINTFGMVYQQMYEIDLRERYPAIDIPVYFFTGRHDINAPPALVEDYYQMLDAPDKDLVWFEHSGHSPWLNETERFVEQVGKYFSHESTS